MKTPDLTLVQVVAIVGAFLAIVAAVGLPLSEAHGWMVAVIATSVAVALVLGDALIRWGRAVMSGNKFNDEDLDLD